MYQGYSEGFKALQEGYFDYAAQVNTSRSIPDVRDGLKPVHRRILTALNERKLFKLGKAASVIGATMELHPHGDASIYDAACLMSESNASWNIPLLQSAGNLGKVYTQVTPAAFRYTELGGNAWAKEFLNDLDCAPLVPASSGKGMEYGALTVPYPFILTVGHKGLGVGLSSHIPPFNFWEVIDLTRTYLENGSFEDTIILPDFPTGGSIVVDPVEAIKLMYTGRGTLQVRCSYTIDRNVINITSVLPGTTVESLKAKIEALESDLIRSVANTSDLQNGCRLTVITRKGAEEEVEKLLYQKRILQTPYTPNMVYSDNGEVFQGGVYPMIEAWVRYRRNFVEKRITRDLAGIKTELSRLEYLIRLVEDTPNRDKYLDLVVNDSQSSANSFLFSLFEGIPSDVVDWIYARRVSTFHKNNSYRSRYDTLQNSLQALESDLDNIDGVLIRELDAVSEAHQGHHERKTDYSDTAVVVSKKSQAKEVDNSIMHFIWNMDAGTITKTRNAPVSTSDSLKTFVGKSSDFLLLGITSDSHLVKVWGSNLEPDQPTSITKMCGVDSEVIHLVPSDSEDCVLVFKDRLSFWSPSVEYSARRTKLKRNNFPPLGDLQAILPESAFDSFAWANVDGDSVLFYNVSLPLMDRPKQSQTATKPVWLSKPITHWAANIVSKYEVLLKAPVSYFEGGLNEF